MLCPTCTTWRDGGTNPEPVPTPPMPAGTAQGRSALSTETKFMEGFNVLKLNVLCRRLPRIRQDHCSITVASALEGESQQTGASGKLTRGQPKPASFWVRV